MSSPAPGEDLYLYLATNPAVVSAVLVREDSAVQKPVYYVSRILRDAETRYSPIEKMAYALIVAARKLRPYFQAHRIKVMTKEPLKKAL